jgi:putative tryptophan/tyrosine transport system substrate-binding protein
VLLNSNRGDTAPQKKAIDNEMKANACTPIYRDINGPDTIKDIFDLFHGDIHALLVAADPFFNNDRQEIVARANAYRFPAIYQWCEFVELGGLMSYGPSLTQCYQWAGAIAVQILDGTIGPPYPVREPNYPGDFALCVSQAAAKGLNMWPLPAAITGCAQYTPEP